VYSELTNEWRHLAVAFGDASSDPRRYSEVELVHSLRHPVLEVMFSTSCVLPSVANVSRTQVVKANLDF